jgi:hypothetical protein
MLFATTVSSATASARTSFHAGLANPPASIRRTIQVILAGWVADYPSAYNLVSERLAA